MRRAIILPAAAGCFQFCILYAGRLNFEITRNNRYIIVGVRLIIRCQYFQICSDCLISIGPAIGNCTQIICCDQAGHGSCKCRIRVIKVFPVPCNFDFCIFRCNLNRHIFCNQVCITGSGCFHADCLNSIRYICHARYICRPAAVSGLVVNGVACSAFHLCRCTAGTSVIRPASTGCLKFSTFDGSRLNFKIALIYCYIIVGICFIICC